MSHQTGIKCDETLKKVFQECTTNGIIRCFKVIINNETLLCAQSVEKSTDLWQDEFDDTITKMLVNKQACYIMYQLSSKEDWLFILYSPDNAPVREKTLYAATRATFKSEFGGRFISDEMFGNSKRDVSYEGYLEHKSHKAAPPPLTSQEEERKYLHETEGNLPHGSSTRLQTVQDIAFPISEDARRALHDFTEGTINHIELNIDLSNESILPTTPGKISASDLEALISVDRSGYHLFNYQHQHDGKDFSSNFFIYSMPGHFIPIKSRMLYSSCKAPLLTVLEEEFKINIDKKLECDGNEKLSEDYLRNELHPPTVDARRHFNKPKAPGRRAPTRKHRLSETSTE